MNLRKITVISLSLALMFSLCGCKKDASVQQSSSEEKSKSVSSESSVKEIKQIIRKKAEIKEKPELKGFELIAECDGNLEKACSVMPYYPGHVIVSSTVGIIGAPVYITDSNNIRNAVLKLYYDENELRGVPEKNLRILHFPESVNDFDLRTENEPDMLRKCVSCDVKEDGYYLLVDIYEYGKAMGMNVDSYAYDKDKTSYISDWEREGYTGDILSLIDKDRIKSKNNIFNVSTPSDLADAVYYSNVLSQNETVYITLENDIDLKDLKWAPMGWNSDIMLSVDINGQGHTINNLSIDMGKRQHSGLTGYAKNITMKDITLENVSIKGGMFVGAISGECHFNKFFENVRVSGNVYGNERNTGAFIGAGNKGNYSGCINEVCVNNKPSHFFCSEDAFMAENSQEELYNVKIDKDYTITRNKGSQEVQSGQIKLRNLSWVLLNEQGGNVLSRLAENEIVFPNDILQKVTGGSGHYTLHLEAFKDSGYIKVSNTIDIYFSNEE